ncbi:MAG TPA: ribonuclease HI family protein [Candidatus Omnitrophica bacterium]|nr:ribonuclease HI family protein [Candidatus Omnitrophota bacterium]
MSRYKVFIDGASSGNPGPAGVGVVIKDNQGKTLHSFSFFIGEATNNIAEYFSLLLALNECLLLNLKNIDIYSDSQLVIKQLKGEYKIRDNTLKVLYKIVKYLTTKFDRIGYNYIEREKNKEADKLASQAIREHKRMLF